MSDFSMKRIEYIAYKISFDCGLRYKKKGLVHLNMQELEDGINYIINNNNKIKHNLNFLLGVEIGAKLMNEDVYYDNYNFDKISDSFWVYSALEGALASPAVCEDHLYNFGKCYINEELNKIKNIAPSQRKDKFVKFVDNGSFVSIHLHEQKASSDNWRITFSKKNVSQCQHVQTNDSLFEIVELKDGVLVGKEDVVTPIEGVIEWVDTPSNYNTLSSYLSVNLIVAVIHKDINSYELIHKDTQRCF